MPNDYLSSRYVTKAGAPSSTGGTHFYNEADLSFDEVAKYFSSPIAEAATILGVSTAFLKRICKENGLHRWPHLKVLAGKTIEEVKKEAAKEKALMEVMSRKSLASPVQGISATGDSVPSGKGGWASSYNMRRGRTARMSLSHPPIPPAAVAAAHMRVNIPTFLDEFKHGFPTRKGLARVSNRWWGARPESDNKPPVQRNAVSSLTSEMEKAVTSVDASRKTQVSSEEDESMPASILVRTRKKALESGKKALNLSVTKGYGAYRLGEKDSLLLEVVFGDYLPAQWKPNMSAY